jgi:RNA polymerase-binding transcription factor DksA
MDNNRKDVIRKIIEKRISELEQVLSSTTEADDVRTEQLSDEATRFDALANLSVDSTLLARAQDDLSLLHRQLEHIDYDDFGLCWLCGEEIAANRIVSVPSTVLCIRCAQQQENKQ